MMRMLDSRLSAVGLLRWVTWFALIGMWLLPVSADTAQSPMELFREACLSDRGAVSYGAVLAALDSKPSAPSLDAPSKAVIHDISEVFLGKRQIGPYPSEICGEAGPAAQALHRKLLRLQEGQSRLAGLIARKRERQKEVLATSIRRWQNQEGLSDTIVTNIRGKLFAMLDRDGIVPTDDQIEDMIVRLLMEDLLR